MFLKETKKSVCDLLDGGIIEPSHGVQNILYKHFTQTRYWGQKESQDTNPRGAWVGRCSIWNNTHTRFSKTVKKQHTQTLIGSRRKVKKRVFLVVFFW